MFSNLANNLALAGASVLLTIGVAEATSHFFSVLQSPAPAFHPLPMKEFLSPTQEKSLEKSLARRVKLKSSEEIEVLNSQAIREGLDYSRKFGGDSAPSERYHSVVSTQESQITLYDAWIHRDKAGRRIVAGFNPQGSEGAAFLGDSFVFGEGVNDAETLPSIVQESHPWLSIHNLGIPGAGPNDILFRLSDTGDAFFDGIDLKGGTVFYFFQGFSPQRASCDLQSYYVPHLQKQRERPFYELTNSDELAYLGLCRNQENRNLVFNLLSHSNFVRRNNLNWPWPGSDYLKILNARILKEIREISLKRFNAKNFVAVMYPDLLGISPHYVPFFREAGLEVLDLSQFNLITATKFNHRIPGDQHPTYASHIVIAELLSWKTSLGQRAN